MPELDGVAVRAALAARLEDADRQAGLRQVGGGRQSVDAAADDDHVVVLHCGLSGAGSRRIHAPCVRAPGEEAADQEAHVRKAARLERVGDDGGIDAGAADDDDVALARQALQTAAEVEERNLVRVGQALHEPALHAEAHVEKVVAFVIQERGVDLPR